MNIKSIQYRDFLSIEFGNDEGFGIVSSVDEQNNTVTFSKFDILKKKQNKYRCFKGILENLTLNFSNDRFKHCAIYGYFNFCYYYGLKSNFTLDDFFKKDDLIDTGMTRSKNDKLWNIIGLVDHTEVKLINGSEFKFIYLTNPMLYSGYELIPANEETKKIVYPFRFSSSFVRLLNNSKLREIYMMYETCKDYTIQGLLV